MLVLAVSTASCTRSAPDARLETAEVVPPEQLFESIRTAVSAGKLELATRLIEENQSRFTDSRTVDRLNFMRGWAAYTQGKFDLARIWLEQIPHTNLGLAPVCLYFRAKSHEASGDTERAINLYEQLIERYPFSRRSVESRYDAANLYFRLGRFEQAAALYEMMRRNPNLQGELYIANRPAVLMNSGDTLLALGQSKDALDRFETLYYEFPLTPEAEVAADRIVKIRQEAGLPPLFADPPRTLVRARKLLDGGRTVSAIRELEAVLPALREKGGRERIDALTAYAQALERDRQLSAARNIYDQITALPGADLASMRFRSAQVTARSNEDLGIQRFLKVAEDFPASPVAADALYNAARFHHVAGRDPEARKLYERIVQTYPKSALAASSRFQIGWLDYLAGNMETASTWLRAASASTSDEEYERSLYWLGRTLEKSGQQDEADQIYSRLWTERNWHYYGGMAKGRLSRLSAPEIYRQMLSGNSGSGVRAPPLRHEPELMQIADSFEGLRRDAVPSAAEMIVLGLFREAADELDFIARGNPPNEQVSRLLPLLEETHDYLRLRTWGWNTLGKPSAPEVSNVRSWRALYPRAYLDHVNPMAEQNRLDARFILAIIREESAYDPKALSIANAHGLMQLIPPTAENVARSLGLKRPSIDDLRIPETNVRLGSAYLRQLIDQFNGNMVFAIASYNGGPHNVNRWRERLGGLELDEFVEEIPFRETRNYVKKIFKSWSNYRLLYGPEGEQLYTLALEQMLAPKPTQASGVPTLGPVNLSGWLRPELPQPPVITPVPVDPYRGFDPAHEYPLVQDNSASPGPVRLSDAAATPVTP